MFVSTATIFAWLLRYTYQIFFPLAVVEGPIITIIAGFLVSQHYLGFVPIYCLAVTADLTGDCLYYAFAASGGKKFIRRFGHWIGISLDQVEEVKAHFKKHRGKTLIIGKLTQLPGLAILLAAGLVRMPLLEFVWFNFVASIPKTAVLLIVGYYFGKAFEQINSYATYVSLVSLGLCIAVYIGYLCWLRKRRRQVIEENVIVKNDQIH